MAAFRAVWPPRVGRIASGFSFAIIFDHPGVMGSMQVASANSGSVMMVAGLEFTRMTRTPSLLQHAQCLGAGVVEFRCLTDDDRAEPMTRTLLRSVRRGI